MYLQNVGVYKETILGGELGIDRNSNYNNIRSSQFDCNLGTRIVTLDEVYDNL